MNKPLASVCLHLALEPTLLTIPVVEGHQTYVLETSGPQICGVLGLECLLHVEYRLENELGEKENWEWILTDNSSSSVSVYDEREARPKSYAIKTGIGLLMFCLI